MRKESRVPDTPPEDDREVSPGTLKVGGGGGFLLDFRGKIFPMLRCEGSCSKR